MTLIREPYTNMGKETGKDTLRIRLNEQEAAMLAKAQQVLNQTKPGTALKQLAKIGYANVVNNPQTVEMLKIIYNNKRKNERLGIPDFENSE